MGLENIGTTIGKEVIVWIRTNGSKSLLATKPIKINPTGIKIAPQLERDAVRITKTDYLANIKRLGLNEKDSKLLEDLLTANFLPEDLINEFRQIFNRVTNRTDIDRNGLRKFFTGEEEINFFSKRRYWNNDALDSHEKLYVILQRLESSLQPKDLEIIKHFNKESCACLIKKNIVDEFILPNEYIKKLSEILKNDDIFITNELNKQIIKCYGKNKTYFTYDKKNEILEIFEENGINKIKTIRNINGNEAIYQINPENDKLNKLLEETICLKDSNGKIAELIKYKKSDIDGIFNVVKRDLKTGKETLLSQTFIDSSGKKIVKQHLVSPSGTKTHVNYEEMPNGSTQYTYKIVDKNNNILMEQTRSRTVLNDSEFLHIINDSRYNVKFLGSDKIEILNTDTKQLDVIDLKGLLSKLTNTEKANMIAMLKRLPADELLALNKCEINQLLQGSIEKASTLFESGSIASTTNEFVFLHEFGHQKDMTKNHFSKKERELINKVQKDFVKPKSDEEMEVDMQKMMNNPKYLRECMDKRIKQWNVLEKAGNISNKAKISSNPELLKIYKKERSAYISRFGTDDKRIDYFINTPGLAFGPQGEAIAEINALLSTPKGEALLGTRSYLLAENFPETIAFASKLLS